MTAHADICSRLLSAADRYASDDFAGIPATKETVSHNYRQAAALIQQMVSDLVNCNEASSLKDAAIALNFQRAESAESQLADLRAKLAAADAGMPAIPNYLKLRNGWTEGINGDRQPTYGQYVRDSDYDALRTLATAQAVRIADIVHEIKLIEEHHVYLNKKAGRRESDSHTLKLVRAALQLAAKHD